MAAKKERIFYYDLLRAFAIIAVIICHVDHFFGPLTSTTQVIAQMTFHDIGDIGVPIFLMISGALLLNRDYPIIMATTIFLSALVIFMNLIVDILYKVVDPRIDVTKGGEA